MDSRYLIVKRARERITDPAHWCQGVLATDANGNEIPLLAPDAVRWCAFGALLIEAPDGRLMATSLSLMMEHLDGREITWVNDIGHEDILAYLDNALVRLALSPEAA